MTDICNILLVQLYSELQPPNAEPLSIEVLSSAIERYCQNCQVELMVVNPAIQPNALQEFFGTLSYGDFRLVGLSVPQGTYRLALDLLSSFETLESSKRPLVVLGHAIPTFAPGAFLDLFPWTVIVRGWGEDAIINLVQKLQAGEVQLESVPGIVYAHDGQIMSTPMNNQVVPQTPKRLHTGKYFARLETSRGCHYGRCTFCTRPPGRKDYWSRLPLEALLSSVRELKEQGISYFTFTDEDFIGNDLEGALKISEGITQIGNMSFSLSVRADNIFNANGSTEENLKRTEVFKVLHQAGLSMVFIGLESLSEFQLRRYGKGIQVEESVYAVEIIKSLGIPVEVGFILFDPFVRVQELRQIASILRSTGIWRNVGNLFTKMRVQKDTPYEIWLRKRDLLKDFDVNLISYGWELQNQEVSVVARACQNWSDTFDSIHRLLRNLERTTKGNKIAGKYMTAFRLLDLMVLEHVVKKLEDECVTLAIDNSFYQRRRSFIASLGHALDSKGQSDEEILLLEQIDKYISSSKDIL